MKNKKVKVTVVVATYRRDDILKKALLSLTQQTFKNIEVLVVSDNADIEWNNRVQKIVTEIKKEHNIDIKAMFNNENLKSAETRNIGINNASGQYITFLDDDDIYLSKKIESQLKKMVEDNSDFSITNLDLYNLKGTKIDSRKRVGLNSSMSREELLLYHLKYHIAGTDTLMFKASYLQKIEGFEKTNMSDEFFLILKAIENNGKFSYYDECYVKALVHGKNGGISSGMSKVTREINLYKYKANFFASLDKKDIRYIKARHYLTLAYAFLRMKSVFRFLKYFIKAIIVSPINCVKILIRR